MGMLEGRVAICAGAGRGVGAEVAKLMAANGAKVVINDPGTSGSGEGSDQTPAQEIVDQIKAAGGEAAANYGSVAKFDDCLAMVQPAGCTSFSTPPASCATRCSITCSPRIGRPSSMYT
jgi:NAD(P)-dependent dehydrogenase (short-subunit alcohol dehydrogenase family)